MQTIKTIDLLVEDRSRQDYGSIVELAASIKKLGLLQPLVVMRLEEPVENKHYKLLAGGRRYQALMMLCKQEIPVVLKEELSQVEQLEIELEENIRRKDLTWPERISMLLKIDELKRAQARKTTIDNVTYGDNKGGWSVQKTAALVEKSVGSVSQDIALAKDMRDNPDLAVKVQGLSKVMAKKRMNELLREKNAKIFLKKEKQDPSSAIKLGSCLSLIKALQDSSVDLCITDPPYDCSTMNDRGSRLGASYASKEIEMSGGGMYAVYQTLLPELHRVLKDGAHVYIFYAMEWDHKLKMLLKENGFDVDDRPIIWNKNQTTGKPTDWHYTPMYETILFAIKLPKSRPLLNACGDMMTIPPIHSSKRVHSLQKPSELLQKLINNSSVMGDLVLDPFAGSGSTLKTAIKLGRRAIGFEMDETNYMEAVKFMKSEDSVY